MDCPKHDSPINVTVQMFFAAGDAPDLSSLTRRAGAHLAAARTRIRPGGTAFDLPGAERLTLSRDTIGPGGRYDVVTLAFSQQGGKAAGSEADRLDRQSRALQPLICNLDAAEVHWHLLPGRLDRTAEKRLAQRSLEFLGRPVWSTRPASANLVNARQSAHAGRRPLLRPPLPRLAVGMPALPTPANDRPALPCAPEKTILRIHDRLGQGDPAGREHLSFQCGARASLVMILSA